ncbi:hypothetical protein L7F22_027277 [Adiantum nelumboides]|nr:hypothetical protein [Adiantum nelumboides]
MVKREAVKVEEGIVKEESSPVKQEFVKKEEEEDDDCIITSVAMASSSRAEPSSYRPYESERAANGRMKGKAKAKWNAIKKNGMKSKAKKSSSLSSKSKKEIKAESKVKKDSKKAPSKTKKEIKDEEQNGEKRGAIFRKAPSRKVMERVERVNCQRMFLLDREQKQEGSQQQASSSSNALANLTLREEFKVLGSTGNVYTVTIDREPRCDCPDWKNHAGDPCKHTIFVFLRVLGINQNSHTWYQKSLLTSELQNIFASARPDPTHSNPSLQSAYLKAISGVRKEEDNTKGDDDGKRRVPQKGDVCPVCYEEFAEGISKDLVFCEESCGNPLHKKCATEWSKACKRSYQDVTCIYCRAHMVKKEEVKFSKEGDYMNIAGPSSLVDRNRDFSIYSWSSIWAMRRRGTLSEEQYEDYMVGYVSGGNESDDDL